MATNPTPTRRVRWLPNLDRVTARTATLLALLALLLLGGLWVDSRHDIARLKNDLSQRLGDADALVKQNQDVSEKAERFTRTAEDRLAAIEAKLATSQNQQVALEALYQELSRNRDDWVLAEVEQLVVIANQQLQLTGNVQSALSALQSADTRLQKMDRPALVALRRALNQDIDRLRALPFVDTTGISIRIDSISATVDALPLASETRPVAEKPAPPAVPEGTVARMGHELALELAKAVQIRRIDAPELPLLSPDQAFFLRENLKLRLMSARLGALSRNEDSYKADVHTATDWLNRYFDRTAKPVQADLESLRQLNNTPVSIALPDVNATLNAVRNARLPNKAPQR